MVMNLLILGSLEWGGTGPAQVNVTCTVIHRRRVVGGWLSGQVGRLRLLDTNIDMVEGHWWRHGGSLQAGVCVGVGVDDLTRGKTGGIVSSTVVVVSAVGGAGSIVVTAHIRDRRGIHASLDHGGRTRGESAMIVRKHLRLVVKHSGLTSEDVGIEGIATLSLLQTAL